MSLDICFNYNYRDLDYKINNMPSRELNGLQIDTQFKYATISTPDPKSNDINTETALRSKQKFESRISIQT